MVGIKTLIIKFLCINLERCCNYLIQIQLGYEFYHLKLFILTGKIRYINIDVMWGPGVFLFISTLKNIFENLSTGGIGNMYYIGKKDVLGVET